MINILAIGDVVGNAAAEFLRKKLPAFCKLKGVDLVICNGENTNNNNGIAPKDAAILFDSGVDVITTGNHVFKRREVYDYLDEEKYIIRPANYPDDVPGKGACIFDTGKARVLVCNLLGTVYMDTIDCPFKAADALLERYAGKYDAAVFDFHAEATSEKKAMAFYLDGRASVLFGTHTHVQTADECVMPQGLGYITDVGMTGAESSVLGIRSEAALEKFLRKMPIKYEPATQNMRICGAIFSVDEKTGKASSAERVIFE